MQSRRFVPREAVDAARRAGVPLRCDRSPLTTAKPATSARTMAATSSEPSQVTSLAFPASLRPTRVISP